MALPAPLSVKRMTQAKCRSFGEGCSVCREKKTMPANWKGCGAPAPAQNESLSGSGTEKGGSLERNESAMLLSSSSRAHPSRSVRRLSDLRDYEQYQAGAARLAPRDKFAPAEPAGVRSMVLVYWICLSSISGLRLTAGPAATGSGRKILTQVPCLPGLSVLRKVMCPPFLSTTAFAIQSPRPVPFSVLVE